MKYITITKSGSSHTRHVKAGHTKIIQSHLRQTQERATKHKTKKKMIAQKHSCSIKGNTTDHDS